MPKWQNKQKTLHQKLLKIRTRCLNALSGVLVLEGDLVADVALRAPLCASIEELRDFWELGGPVVFSFGSLDRPEMAADVPTPPAAPTVELRFGCVQGFDVPIDRRLSILTLPAIELNMWRASKWTVSRAETCFYKSTVLPLSRFSVISNPTCRNQFQELVHPHKCKQVHIFGKGCLRKKVYDKGFAKLKSQGISFDTLPLFLKSKHFKKHLNNVKIGYG